jgi:hypothetical protein
MCVHSAQNKETGTKFKRPECNVRLYASSCFAVHQTELHFEGPSYTKQKSGTQKHQLTLPLQSLNWYFSVAFSW